MPRVCRFLLVLTALACSPAVTPGPTPVPIPEGTCESAEARLQELHCIQDGVDLWAGFAEECESSARDGVDFHPACITAVTSCSQVDQAWQEGCSQ